MYKYIWLVPLLPLAGAAINGIFGRWFRFPEKLVGGIAVGTVALSFLVSLAARQDSYGSFVAANDVRIFSKIIFEVSRSVIASCGDVGVTIVKPFCKTDQLANFWYPVCQDIHQVRDQDFIF